MGKRKVGENTLAADLSEARIQLSRNISQLLEQFREDTGFLVKEIKIVTQEFNENIPRRYGGIVVKHDALWPEFARNFER